jgi:beta-phosphoglucomutase-like phosphatase (HAD superfamily)
MGKIVLIDLDGTLTDTAHESFKPQKDGQVVTVVENIPIIKGAKEFIKKLKENGHVPIIISDSHPRYVDIIAERHFGVIAMSLADKPNSAKTKDFLKIKYPDINFSNDCLVIGDTWLDIELGRALNCPTVLATFYKTDTNDERDGIGNTLKHLKSGPTYVTDSFDRIIEILANPCNYLLAAEAVFQESSSKQSRKFYTDNQNGVLTAFRSLGRMNSGETDKYAIASKYFEFQRADRSEQTVSLLAQSVDNYLNFVIENTTGYKWDILTYVSDKKTTTPPNKMSHLFDQLKLGVPKEKLVYWGENIEGSIRDQKHYKERKEFVIKNVFIESQSELKDKNVIIIDDQYTTGGTAFAITNLLRAKGVKNILFVTLFYLISNVENEKLCPNCNKRLKLKINRADGNKFLSCPIPKYGGDGCGYRENIIQ